MNTLLYNINLIHAHRTMQCYNLTVYIRHANHIVINNINPADAGAQLLIVSQFTLWADCRSRRPGFTAAARPDTAIPLYERVQEVCRSRGFTVETGEFGADMQVASVNDGPVTIILDTREL